jgi:hypothetical protein
MYMVVKYFHSYIAALTLAFIILAIVYNIYSMVKKKAFIKTNNLANLLGMVSAHIQLLFGLVLYFVSPLGFSMFSGAAMKNSLTRLYILEHPFTMIIAVALITLGYLKAKKALDDKQKYKRIVIFYSIGLLLILSRVPWNSWIIFN